jgi:hypothetical protein
MLFTSASVYGIFMSANSVRSAPLHDPPGVHHGDPSVRPATTPGRG